MFETQPDRNRRSTREVILGFLLGVLASLLCLAFCILWGSTFGGPNRPFPVINGLALLGIGVIALRKVRESSYALGADCCLAGVSAECGLWRGLLQVEESGTDLRP
jgi:hypothetical protein